MKSKKILSMAMALILSVSVATTGVFAEGGATSGGGGGSSSGGSSSSAGGSTYVTPTPTSGSLTGGGGGGSTSGVINDATISVSSATALPGKNVSIDISLENNPGIAIMKLGVRYDSSALTLIDVKDAGVLGTATHSDNYSLNPYQLYWNNGTAISNYTANGKIITLTFAVDSKAEEGNYPIYVSYDNINSNDIMDRYLAPVEFDTYRGIISVVNTVCGDVNGDAKVTALDNAILARYIAKWIGYDNTTVIRDAADVNEDGKVTALDNAILARYIAKWIGYDKLPYSQGGSNTDDQEKYRHAYEVLRSLGIIAGYEDGNDRLEGEVTRAEAAVLLVFALNMREEAMAAAGTPSQYADVNAQASWATGYINVVTRLGLMTGYDSDTFAPADLVTYGGMCVMLTRITGYGDYAEAYGGYPTGYLAMATASGINAGVEHLSLDHAITRGEFSQMLYNALTIPVLGVVSYSLSGNTYAKLDGTDGREFKSLLSDKFDAYIVRATVNSFPGAGGVRLTDVSSDYSKAKNASKYFSIVPTATSNGTIERVNIWNSMFFTSWVKQKLEMVLIQQGGNIYLVYAEAIDSDNEKYVDASTFEYISFDADNIIRFDGTRERFNNTVNVYVNGAFYGTYTKGSANDGLSAVLRAATGDIKLVKQETASSGYDTIIVDVYTIAQVSAIWYINGVTTVNFVPAGNSLNNYRRIQILDEDIDAVYVEFEGEEVNPKYLQEGDVVAIKAPLGTGDTIYSSNTDMEILATDDTIGGMVTRIEYDYSELTIDGTDYGVVDPYNLGMQVGTIYNTIYLDPFGRVFGYDPYSMVDNTKYAILAKIEDDMVQLILPDGSRKWYEINSPDVFPSDIKALEISGTAPASVTKTDDPTQCVISYQIKNSTGKISYISKQEATPFEAPYKAVVQKIGPVGMGDNTKIIVADTDSYRDYIAISPSQLVDGKEYIGAGFGRHYGTNEYSFVILTSTGIKFDADSRFAVGKSTIGSTTLDDDKIYTLMLADGEVLNISEIANVYDYTGGGSPEPKRIDHWEDLQGKAFYFTTDFDGLVDNIYIVFNGDAPTYTKAAVAALANDGLIDGDDWTATLFGSSSQDIRLVYGLVSNADSSSVTFVNDASVDPLGLGKNFIEMADIERFNFANDCAKYSYDINNQDIIKKADKINEGGLYKSDFKLFEYRNDSSLVWKKVAGAGTANQTIAHALDEDDWRDYANYAIAMIVNEQIVEIYEIIK